MWLESNTGITLRKQQINLHSKILYLSRKEIKLLTQLIAVATSLEKLGFQYKYTCINLTPKKWWLSTNIIIMYTHRLIKALQHTRSKCLKMSTQTTYCFGIKTKIHRFYSGSLDLYLTKFVFLKLFSELFKTIKNTSHNYYQNEFSQCIN